MSLPPSAPGPSARPEWAARLDRWALVAARWGGRLLGRPREELLAKLARRDRPGLASGEAPPTAHRSPEAHIAAGRAAFGAGQHAEALHHFGLALEVAPEAAWAWHGRGDALQRMGVYEAALLAYSRAAALAPRTGLHHGGRANALAALGREELAENAWSEAMLLDPSLGWMRNGARQG